MRLKRLRENLSLTQKQLGDMLGVEQNTVSQWETGYRLPRTEKLTQIASALNCKVDDLFDDPKQ